MKCAILTTRGFITSYGSTKVYIDSRAVLKDMSSGDQVVLFPKVGRSAEYMKLIRAMRRWENK